MVCSWKRARSWARTLQILTSPTLRSDLDSTTNPSLIATAAQMPQYQPIADGVLLEARKELGKDASDPDVANLAFRSGLHHQPIVDCHCRSDAAIPAHRGWCAPGSAQGVGQGRFRS